MPISQRVLYTNLVMVMIQIVIFSITYPASGESMVVTALALTITYFLVGLFSTFVVKKWIEVMTVTGNALTMLGVFLILVDLTQLGWAYLLTAVVTCAVVAIVQEGGRTRDGGLEVFLTSLPLGIGVVYAVANTTAGLLEYEISKFFDTKPR